MSSAEVCALVVHFPGPLAFQWAVISRHGGFQFFKEALLPYFGVQMSRERFMFTNADMRNAKPCSVNFFKDMHLQIEQFVEEFCDNYSELLEAIRPNSRLP